MNILYDYQAFMMQTHGGVSKCFAELIAHLPPYISYQAGIKESNNLYLKDKKLVPNLQSCKLTLNNFLVPFSFKGKGTIFNWINQKYPQFPSSININKNYCIELIKSQKFDIFHPTFFDLYYLDYIGKKPFVLTVHDMTPELFPQYYPSNYYQIKNKKILADKATHIIAVSEQTKKDLIDFLQIPEKKITVIYHGAPDIIEKQNRPIVTGNYILYIGNREAYKNFNKFIYSFAQILKTRPSLQLVCTGKPFNNKERTLFSKLQITDNIIHLFTNDFQLNNLYQHALAFIYPSLYEGFGIPILEAYANNCPVLLNKKSCFPEIAQDAAMYFLLDEQHNTFIETMNTFLDNYSEFRSDLINKGKKQLQKFSWETSAKQLANVYENII